MGEKLNGRERKGKTHKKYLSIHCGLRIQEALPLLRCNLMKKKSSAEGLEAHSRITAGSGSNIEVE